MSARYLHEMSNCRVNQKSSVRSIRINDFNQLSLRLPCPFLSTSSVGSTPPITRAQTYTSRFQSLQNINGNLVDISIPVYGVEHISRSIPICKWGCLLMVRGKSRIYCFFVIIRATFFLPISTRAASRGLPQLSGKSKTGFVQSLLRNSFEGLVF